MIKLKWDASLDCALKILSSSKKFFSYWKFIYIFSFWICKKSALYLLLSVLSWEEGSTIFQVLERIVHFLLLLFPSSHSLLNYRISLCPSYSTFTAQCPNWPLYTKSNVPFLLLISSTFSPFFNISPLLLKYFIYHASRYPTLLFIFFKNYYYSIVDLQCCASFCFIAK